MKPTAAQKKEFWEKLEVKRRNLSEYGRLPNWDYPPIDLNNLFKYAVRELRERIGYVATVRLLVRWVHKFMKEGLDPALALFWAIWEVKG